MKKISTKTFSGFTYKIPSEIVNIMTVDYIIDEVKTYMVNIFDSYDLYLLKAEAKQLELHIHDELPFTSDKIIYLCDHKH